MKKFIVEHIEEITYGTLMTSIMGFCYICFMLGKLDA